jgi:hypothetical protein
VSTACGLQKDCATPYLLYSHAISEVPQGM